MPYLSKVYGFLRLGYGLNAFLRNPISIENAKNIVRQGMQHREDALLRMVDRGIFANPRSPYLKLFQAAGCEFGDVKNIVKQEGVEGTLHRLLQSGIYITYEEFKGRKPAIRGSQTFHFRDTDFDNPLITAYFESSSGGTRGRPTRVQVDLDHIAQSAPHWCLWFAAHNLLESPLLFWTPSHTGSANRHLMCAKFGKRFVKSFSYASVGTLKDQLISTLVHSLIRRAAGFPKREFVSLTDATKVGNELAKLLRHGTKPCINTSPSSAVRICLAMQECGISLRNVTFLLGAEPLTPARKETIEAVGAKAVPTYGFSEGGSVGSQCPNPIAADDIHISMDAYGVIQRPPSLGSGEMMNVLLLTALRPACPKILLNTEIGDYAVLETRRCGCLFDELGYFRHLHSIRSFQKLTGEGVTIMGADVFRLLEEVIPKKFGGTLSDYQLIEQQAERGQPQYSLLVSPELGALDHQALATVFLEELSKLKSSYRYSTMLWSETGALQVKRQHPIPTARGKVLPFHTLGP